MKTYKEIKTLKPKQTMNKIFLMDIAVKGTTFAIKKDLFPTLGVSVGDPVYFKLEPENKFDEHAVEIFWNNTPIGYVPKGFYLVKNILIQTQDDKFPAPFKLTGTIRSIDLANWKYEPIAVALHLEFSPQIEPFATA